MRKTKSTRFASLFLSAASVLTALPVTAATSKNNSVTEQSITISIESQAETRDDVLERAINTPAAVISRAAPIEQISDTSVTINYLVYPLATILNAARTTPYEVILEVTYQGKTYYFDGSGPDALSVKPTSGGYIVQGI